MPGERVRRIRLVLAVTIVAVFIFAPKSTTEKIRLSVISACAPAWQVVRDAATQVAQWTGISEPEKKPMATDEIRRENESIRNEVNLLRQAVSKLTDISPIYGNLRNIATARVCFVKKSSAGMTLVISAGYERGVRKGMYILSGRTYIGVVSETLSDTSFVIPATSRGQTFKATDIKASIPLTATGTGTYISVKFVPDELQINKGDSIFVFSDDEGNLPPSLLLGTVKEKVRSVRNLCDLIVEPALDYDKLMLVQIIGR